MPEWLKLMPKPIQWAVGLLLAFTTLWLPAAKLATLWPFGAGEIRISIEANRQFEMMKAHLIEAPAKEFVFYEDATGSAKARLYASDSAILTLRTAPGAPTSVHWMARPSAAVAELVQASPAIVAAALAEYVPAGCIQLGAHGDPAREWFEPVDDHGTLHRWWAWADQCSGFFVQYADGSIAYDESGPLFTWVTCSGQH